MNWDTVKGQWKQVQGKVKQKWGQLTDDDLTMINGQKEQLLGKQMAKEIESHLSKEETTNLKREYNKWKDLPTFELIARAKFHMSEGQQ